MDPMIRPQIEAYAEAHTTAEPPLLARVAEETRAMGPLASMLTGRVEGRLLKMLVGMLQPRLVLEIGCFTGYSALSMAEGLPEGGRVITCEIDPGHAQIAQQNFEASPLRDRIELRLGPALETIRQLDGPFGFVFIDADKTGYAGYYDAVIPKLAPGGVIAVDNVLQEGRVLGEGRQDENTRAIASFNRKVADDPRVECVMLTVRDGLTLVRRRDDAGG